ncbi:MAG: ABC transporter permease, partial [Holophagales bacterium]|nr:ABC transporter permease [Holophagales bacterium]
MIRSWWRDSLHGFRLLRRQAGPAAVAVVTLGLGLGAVVTLTGVRAALLDRPSPFPDGHRLVLLWGSLPAAGYDRLPLSDADLEDYRRSDALGSMAAFTVESSILAGAGAPREVSVARVEPDLFRVLGASFALGDCEHFPIAGRAESGAFSECGWAAADAAVISHRLWIAAFRGDPGVLGRPVELDGRRLRVAGVLAAESAFPPPISWQGRTVGDGRGAEIFVPLAVDPSRPRSDRHLLAVARLREDLSLGATNRWLADAALRLAETHPRSNPPELSAFALPLHTQAIEILRGPLRLLGLAGGLLLLVACTNVAQLTLARSVARSDELALRAALGADSRRLSAQLTSEGLALALLGGGLGTLAAWGATRAIARLELPGVPYLADVGIDAGILLSALGASVVSAVLFALLPAIYVASGDLSASLKCAGRATAGSGIRRLQSALVISELALAVALLAAAALLAQDFWQLASTDPGFRTRGLYEARLRCAADPPGANGFDPPILHDLLGRLEADPGVESAALATSLPLTSGLDGSRFTVEGREGESAGRLDLAVVRRVSARYFETLGIPLVEGRALGDGEPASAVVVSRLLARRYWPARSALGRRLTFDDPRSPDARWLEVAGVASDVAEGDLRRSDGTVVYLPLLPSETSPYRPSAASLGEPSRAGETGPATEHDSPGSRTLSLVVALDPSRS